MADDRPSIFTRVSAELGLFSIYNSPTDTKLLCLQRFVRLFAYGLSTLILVLYLSSLGISDAHIGLFMTLTLLGDVGISFVLTLFADGLGRRRILALGAFLMSASGVVFAVSGNYWVLVAASIIGVISPRSVCSAQCESVVIANVPPPVGTRSALSAPSRNQPSRSCPTRTSGVTSLHGTPSSALPAQPLAQSSVDGSFNGSSRLTDGHPSMPIESCLWCTQSWVSSNSSSLSFSAPPWSLNLRSARSPHKRIPKPHPCYKIMRLSAWKPANLLNLPRKLGNQSGHKSPPRLAPSS